MHQRSIDTIADISTDTIADSSTDTIADSSTDTIADSSARSTIAPLASCRGLQPPSVPSLNKGPMMSIGNRAGLVCAARAQLDHRAVT